MGEKNFPASVWNTVKCYIDITSQSEAKFVRKARKSCNIQIYDLANHCTQVNIVNRIDKYVVEWLITNYNGRIAIIESLYEVY